MEMKPGLIDLHSVFFLNFFPKRTFQDKWHRFFPWHTFVPDTELNKLDEIQNIDPTTSGLVSSSLLRHLTPQGRAVGPFMSALRHQ